MYGRYRLPYEGGVADEDILGGDGVSLNGESVQIPGDSYYHDDDVSSINTSVYGGGGAEQPSVFRVVADGDPPTDPIGTTIGSNSGFGKGKMPIARTRNGIVSTCCPTWITESQPWVKVVIALSLALLVGAAVVVILSLGMTGSIDNSSPNSSQGSNKAATSTTLSPTYYKVPTTTSPPAPSPPAPSPSFPPSLSPLTTYSSPPEPRTLPTFPPSFSEPSTFPSMFGAKNPKNP